MEKKQTAVEYLVEQLFKIHNNTTDVKEMNSESIIDQAKQMEKEQIVDAIKTEIKLIGNYFDVDKLEQREQGHHIRFTCILKDRFDHYNETYGNGGHK
jgi:hypothetical protein